MRKINIFALAVIVAVGLLMSGVLQEEKTALPPQDVEALYTELENVVMQKTPTDAIALLEQKSQDSEVAKNCHVLLHHIGVLSYEKYQDFTAASSYQDSFCNSGYIHGVIQAFFGNDSGGVDEKVDEAECAKVGSAFARWQCFHGIGHGVMNAYMRDVPKSIESCEKLPTKESIDSCVNGVLMEQFVVVNHAGEIEQGAEMRADMGFCETLPVQYRPTCYFYAPTAYLKLNNDDYALALQNCTTLTDELKKIYCTSGVGSQLAKDYFWSLGSAKQFCEQAKTPALINACVSGAGAQLVFYTASSAQAYKACDAHFASHKEVCRSSAWTAADPFDI